MTAAINPLMQRMFVANRVVNPTLSEENIVNLSMRVAPLAGRWMDTPHPCCLDDEAERLQTQAAASIHTTVQSLLSRTLGSPAGVMHASDYASAFALTSRFAVPLSSDLGTPAGFTRQDMPCKYQIQEGVAPWAALQNFFKGPTVTDCGGAVEAVYLKAIADVAGEEKFNALFSHPSLRFRMSCGGIYEPGSLLPLFTQTVHTDFGSQDLSHLTLGSRTYIRGIPWYRAKHPSGSGNGLHAICMGRTPAGSPLFWGLDFNQLNTAEDVVDLMLQNYNNPRSADDEGFIQATGSSFQKIVRLDAYPEQVAACLADPDRPYTLDGVKPQVGFYGYAHTDTLSVDVLSLLQKTPLAKMKQETFPHQLAALQTTLTVKEIAKLCR